LQNGEGGGCGGLWRWLAGNAAFFIAGTRAYQRRPAMIKKKYKNAITAALILLTAQFLLLKLWLAAAALFVFYIAARNIIRDAVLTAGKKSINGEFKTSLLLNNLIDIKKLPPAKGPVRARQLAAFEITKEVDRACRKHNINYWIDYGTLLGAVRHGGFIPWDDDIDITMLAHDWEKLKKVLPGETENLRINDPGAEVIKIENGGDFIDIFLAYYVTDIPEDERRAIEKKFHKHRKSAGADHNGGILKNYLIDAGKITENRFILDTAMPAYNACPRRLVVLKEREFFPLKNLKFEGVDLLAPNNAELLLEKTYGADYMSFPSAILDRRHHK